MTTARPTRLAFAAAHVAVKDTYATRDLDALDAIDWDTTVALRRELARHGLGIAEAMDTAQRFEIGWPVARRLIEATGRLELPRGFVAGAGTDHVTAIDGPADLVGAVVEQVHVIREAGGVPVVLPMAWLPRHDAPVETYVEVYRDIAREAGGPLIVHWLGAMFAPELAGSFPGDAFERVMDVDPAAIRGAKLSLLDAEREVELRRHLLRNDQVMFTGDDFSFASLVAGDDPTITRWTTLGDADVALGAFSHALLGILDGIAPAAGRALRRLDAGDVDGFRAIMDPCEALSRIVFEPPTSRYKAGLAFLAWLDGRQPNPMLINHLERERSREHLARVAAAAFAASVFEDEEGARERLRTWKD